MFTPKIYVSTLSLWPRTLKEIQKIYLEAGLDGLQLVPARKIYFDQFSSFVKDSIVSYEGSFRDPKKKWDVVADIFFENEQKVNDTIYWIKKIFPFILSIDIPGDPMSLSEVSPANGTLQSFLQKQGDLVLDTWHMDQYPDIREQNGFMARVIQSKRVQLIHIQTRDWGDYRDFLYGRQSTMQFYLRKMLKSEKPVVIELPFFWLMKRPAEKLRKFKNQILQISAEL